jgi:hypothetical protein
MKTLTLVLVAAVLLLALSAPAGWACDKTCGLTTTPWGEPLAVCLTVPSDSAFRLCIEMNGLGIHTCAVYTECQNGYPVS